MSDELSERLIRLLEQIPQQVQECKVQIIEKVTEAKEQTARDRHAELDKLEARLQLKLNEVQGEVNAIKVWKESFQITTASREGKQSFQIETLWKALAWIVGGGLSIGAGGAGVWKLLERF